MKIRVIIIIILVLILGARCIYNINNYRRGYKLNHTVGIIDTKGAQAGIGSLAFSDGSRLYADDTTSVGENSRNMGDLDVKKMDLLYFSSCNTANPDAKTNIAQAFFDKNTDISTVAGWDGGVAFVPVCKGVFGYKDKLLPSEKQKTATELARQNKHPDRELQGLVELTR